VDGTGIECHEVIIEDEKALAGINQFLAETVDRKDVRDLFHSSFLLKYPDLLRTVDQNEEITQSCMVFLNHSTPYYFLGCRSGRIYGLPVFYDVRKSRTVLMIDP